jgi:hypothetical protein
VFTGKRTKAQAQHGLFDPFANEFDFDVCHLLLSGRENLRMLIEVKLATSLQASEETIENLAGCEKAQHWHQAISSFAVTVHLTRAGTGRKRRIHFRPYQSRHPLRCTSDGDPAISDQHRGNVAS